MAGKTAFIKKYYCSKCHREVEESDKKCPICKAFLPPDGATYSKKVKVNIEEEERKGRFDIEGQKRKTYDTLLIVLLASFVLLFFTLDFEGVFALLLWTFIICYAIFKISMLVYSAKNGDWGWFALCIIASPFSIAYYFAELREKSKKVSPSKKQSKKIKKEEKPRSEWAKVWFGEEDEED